MLHANTAASCPQGDFAANLKLLQRFPPVDAHAILHLAEQLATPQRPTVLAATT